MNALFAALDRLRGFSAEVAALQDPDAEKRDERWPAVRDQLVLAALYEIPQVVEEIVRLRQGLWDVAALCGMDTDGDETPDHMAYPDIVELALREVKRLREDYEVESDSLLGLIIRSEREATAE